MIGPIPKSARPWLLVTVITGILVILALVAQYLLVVQVLNDTVSLAVLLGAILLLLLRYGTIVLHRICGCKTAAHVKQQYRELLLNKLSCLSLSELTPVRRGKINWLLAEGIEVLDLYWGLFVPQFFIGLLGPLSVCVFIIFIDPVIGVSLALLVPLIPMILMLVFKRFASVSATYKDNLANLTEMFTQSLHGLPVLKLYRFSKRWGEQIAAHSQDLRLSTMSLLKVNQLVILLVDLLFSLGTIVLASSLAVSRYQQGAIDVAEMAFVIVVSIELIRPLSLMGAFFFAGALGREVQADIKAFRALPEIANVKVDEEQAEALTMTNLSFAYDAEKAIFKQFNLSVNQGELVVVTGQSGSGKSTLFKLIMGQLDPSQGEIIKSHEKMCYVQQSPYLFNDSLLANLTIGVASHKRSQMTLKSLAPLLASLGLQDLAARELTSLGEEGNKLSGGQMARVALARALLSEHKLYLIDEPTRQLDKENEQLVIDALHRLKEKAGVLVISHSDAVIKQADRVIEITAFSLGESL